MTGAPSGRAIVAGVTGQPVAHSLSPAIHGAWIAAAELDAAYVPLPAPRDGFARLIEGVRFSLRGLNVTAPFKTEAFAAADHRDDVAERCGSANLLLFDGEGRIEARSTDGQGLLAALDEQAPGVTPDLGEAVVLGAGGAAQAAAAALIDAGWRVRVAARRFEASAAVALAVDGALALGWSDLDEALPTAALVVNATGAPELDLPWSAIREGGAALDMTYRPLRTPFLQAAHGRGLTEVDGLAMLIGQARPSFEAFYSSPPPDIDVRSVALRAMAAQP